MEAALRASTRSLLESRGLRDEQTLVWTESAFAQIKGSLRDKNRVIRSIERGGGIDIKKLAGKTETGIAFSLFDCLRVKKLGGDVHKSLANWKPHVKGGSNVGAHEAYLVLACKGATFTTRGDVHIPGVGHVEVKSVGSSSSHACLVDGIAETEARIEARRYLRDEGFEFASLSRSALRTMREILEEAEFVEVIQKLFGILTLDTMTMPKSIAKLILNDPDAEDMLFFAPLAAAALDRCKSKRRFDVCLVINRETGESVFVKDGKGLLASHALGQLRVVPSALGFKNERATSVGVSIPGKDR